MQRSLWRGSVVGVLFVVGLVVMVAWAVTAAPAHAAKLERLKIAIAPTGWDTNFTWLNPRSANLDKRPALEFLVGIDRHTGAYIPELAEKWEMAPDGKSWTIPAQGGQVPRELGRVQRQRCASRGFSHHATGVHWE